MTRKFWIIVTIFLGAAVAALVFVYVRQAPTMQPVGSDKTTAQDNEQQVQDFNSLPIVETSTTTAQVPKAEPSPVGFLYQSDVPFAAQAPFGEWNDIRQQNACEEASALMAVHWARGTSFNLDQAREEFIKMSDWEMEKYGVFQDTSVQDTVDRIFKEYLFFDNLYIQQNVKAEDIIDILAAGHIAVIPMNGQKLSNPYFTPPGPVEHMLVVIGYDPQTNEFITNDPGTRQGKGFRYDVSEFEAAMQEYPTGYHLPIPEVKKTMIVVRKLDEAP